MKLSDNQEEVIKKAVKAISDVIGQTGSINVYDERINAFRYPHPNGVSISIQLSRSFLDQTKKE